MADYVDISCIQQTVSIGMQKCLDLQYTSDDIQRITVARIAPPDMSVGMLHIDSKIASSNVLSAFIGEAPSKQVGAFQLSTAMHSPGLLSTELMKLATEARLADGTTVIGLKRGILLSSDFPAEAKSLKTGNLVTDIGSMFAASKTELEHVTLNAQVSAIGESAFDTCTKLSAIDAMLPVAAGKWAFWGCTSLLAAPPLLSAGVEAFQGCTSMTGDIVCTGPILSNAFWGCTGIQAAWLSGQVGDNAFFECSSLSAVILSSLALGSSSFRRTGLIEVAFPDGMSSVPPISFCECTALTSVSLPASMKAIKNSAFQACTALTGISLPAGLEVLDDHAFAGCTSLGGSIVVPGGVKEVEENCFFGCNLKSVVLEEGVVSVGLQAFVNNAALSSVSFPSTLKHINDKAFYKCAMKDVSLPVVDRIGVQAFWDCQQLSSVQAISVGQIASGAFLYCNAMRSLSVSGMTAAQVKAMPDYPWGLPVECLVNGEPR